MEYVGGDSIYEVYIDTYFLFNFWMNLWVLFLCRFFIHSKVKTIRIIAASFLAAFGEAVVLCIPGGQGGIKLMAGFGGITAFVIAWLFRPGNLKYYYKVLMYSYMSALMLGGSFLILENILGKIKISFAVWEIVIVFLFVFIKKIYGNIEKKNDFCQIVLVFSEEEKCVLTALIDSGNGLLEPISKMPVSIVEERAIEPFKKYLQEEKFRLVPFYSVGNRKGILEAYFIEEMEIRGEGEVCRIKHPIIAVTKDLISVNKEYQMILHPELIKQGGM